MKKFPQDFVWGTSTSAYQIEGGYQDDGKGPSIWDAFTSIPDKIHNQEHAQVANDHYHLYKEDVALMKDMGVTAYRFSIAWSRILPTGSGEVNQEGVRFYSELIDELLAANITPWVTLYHWDLPLALQLEHDGWLGGNISDYFAVYADVCFEHFGDRVKNWITLNEPWVVSILGYGQGVFAPGRISNSEPYLAGHHQLLAHAKAVDIYRKKYSHQKGQIGISNNCDWREPLTDKPEDREAAQRALEFFLGWFADPIFLGKYPQVMRERLGDRLPTFSQKEKDMLKGSSDFFGLNHYTTMYAANATEAKKEIDVYGNGGLSEDQDVDLSVDPAWELTDMKWAVVPWGCRKLLNWIDERYGHPSIIITENGCATCDEVRDGQVHDPKRIEFYNGYLEACHEAIEQGADLKGYFAWSFMDNFEWASGYQKRFGMHYVNYETQERIVKDSARWYAELISKNGIE
ncbi:MAG: beta-glucosidase [Cyclobacteriaceae bacterium]